MINLIQKLNLTKVQAFRIQANNHQKLKLGHLRIWKMIVDK
jgi:hypothetical protein